MKTTYLINSLEGGGAERVFSQLLGLVANDADELESIDVILLDIQPEAYRLPDKVNVYRVGRSMGSAWPFLQFLKVFFLLGRLRNDRVVSFLTRANLINVISAKILNYESVISERSNTMGRFSNKFSGLKTRIVSSIYARADKIIAVSNGVAECLIKDLGLVPAKVAVLNNPVDFISIQAQAKSCSETSYTTSLKPNDAKVIAVGRLVKSKGFEDLIHAYAQSKLHCGLCILGEGPERENLLELIDKLGLQRQVELLGFVKNPYALINKAEVFILSSYLEGFPNALVEAMALATPVIATDCQDGPREILNLNCTIASGDYLETDFGVLVNVGDRAAMASALISLMLEDDLRTKLAANSQERVKQFSKQAFYQQYKNLLQANQDTRKCSAESRGKAT